MSDLSNGAPTAPSKFDLAPSRRKKGKTPWKWQVTAFLKGDKVASQTVHNSELGQGPRGRGAEKRQHIVRVEVAEA